MLASFSLRRQWSMRCEVVRLAAAPAMAVQSNMGMTGSVAFAMAWVGPWIYNVQHIPLNICEWPKSTLCGRHSPATLNAGSTPSPCPPWGVTEPNLTLPNPNPYNCNWPYCVYPIWIMPQLPWCVQHLHCLRGCLGLVLGDGGWVPSCINLNINILSLLYSSLRPL